MLQLALLYVEERPDLVSGVVQTMIVHKEEEEIIYLQKKKEEKVLACTCEHIHEWYKKN